MPAPDRWDRRRRAVEFAKLVVEDLISDCADVEASHPYQRALSLALDSLTLLEDACLSSAPRASEGSMAATTLRDLPESVFAQAQSGRELIYLNCSWLAGQIEREGLKRQVLNYAHRVADDIGPHRVAALRALLDEAWRDAA
jgi:hypothetical protein